MMVTMTFVYNCVYVTGTRTHFTRLFRCLPAPVPPFDHAHSISTILQLMLCYLGGNLSAALISCSATHTRSSNSTIVRACPYSIHFIRLHSVMFYCSSVRYVEI